MSPPQWYKLSSQKIQFTVGTQSDNTLKLNHSFDFENEKRLGLITLTKVDDKATPEKVLEGAVFTITGPNDYSNTQTTGVNGQIQLSGLEPGTYTVTEVKSPDTHNIKVTNTEKPQTRLALTKTDPDGGLNTPTNPPSTPSLPPGVQDKIDELEGSLEEYPERPLTYSELEDLYDLYKDYLYMTEEQKREFERQFDVAKMIGILKAAGYLLPQTGNSSTALFMYGGLLMAGLSMLLIAARTRTRKESFI